MYYSQLGRIPLSDRSCSDLQRMLQRALHRARTAGKSSHRKEGVRSARILRRLISAKCSIARPTPPPALPPAAPPASFVLPPAPFVPPSGSTGGGSPVFSPIPPGYDFGGGAPITTPVGGSLMPSAGGGGGALPVGGSASGAGKPLLTPIPEGFDNFDTGEVSVEPAPMPKIAESPQRPPEQAIDECQLEVAGKLPQVYNDDFGSMAVLRVICGAQAGGSGGGIESVGPLGPVVQSEIETFSGGGLSYIGLARSLG